MLTKKRDVDNAEENKCTKNGMRTRVRFKKYQNDKMIKIFCLF